MTMCPGCSQSVEDCGSDTTTQNDIDNGIVVIEIGFAPFRPAEFVDFRIRHKR